MTIFVFFLAIILFFALIVPGVIGLIFLLRRSLIKSNQDGHPHSHRSERKRKEEEAKARRAEYKAKYERLMAASFRVPKEDLQYVPDEDEVIFYTPVDAWDTEIMLSTWYDRIKEAFKSEGCDFVFLPEFNKEIRLELTTSRMYYYNPNAANQPVVPADILTYGNLKELLCIPDSVDSPCLIRRGRSYGDCLEFTVWYLCDDTEDDVIPSIREYFEYFCGMALYSLASDEDLRRRAEGKPADERFDTDVYLIGKEIRELIEQLRTRGLSTMAIRKLIGDDSDSPGRLFIDRRHRIFLTDYGNREIKLEPLQKVVFFLFLRHPEGILFKELADYKEEMLSIYKEISGRDDSDAIKRSIDRLTDPFDNSINEKCARIKNAFVSEFREEVARWYFIDGSKGERRMIKLPRDLVTWE